MGNFRHFCRNWYKNSRYHK